MSFDSNLRERSAEPDRATRPDAVPNPRGRPSGATAAAARRPAPAWDHGITALGTGVIALAVTLPAAILDAILTRSFGWLFTGAFLLGCVYVGSRVRRAELLGSVVVPPLVFTTAVVIAGQLLPITSDSGWLTRQVLDLATTLALGAPVLLGGTALAGGIALVRRFLPLLGLRLARSGRPRG